MGICNPGAEQAALLNSPAEQPLPTEQLSGREPHGTPWPDLGKGSEQLPLGLPLAVTFQGLLQGWGSGLARPLSPLLPLSL